jgi:hypothetical protein
MPHDHKALIGQLREFLTQQRYNAVVVHRDGDAIPACSHGPIHFNGSRNNVEEMKSSRTAATVVATLLHIMASC